MTSRALQQAEDEVSESRVDQGLWLRACVETGTRDYEARGVRYLELRAEAIQAGEPLALEPVTHDDDSNRGFLSQSLAYRVAASELAAWRPEPILWLRADIDAEGDGERRQLIYAKLRVERLTDRVARGRRHIPQYQQAWEVAKEQGASLMNQDSYAARIREAKLIAAGDTGWLRLDERVRDPYEMFRTLALSSDDSFARDESGHIFITTEHAYQLAQLELARHGELKNYWHMFLLGVGALFVLWSVGAIWQWISRW